MKLKDKITLIGGGTGALGEGIVETFMKEGATVIVPCRSKEKALFLQEYTKKLTGTLIMVDGCLDDDESSSTLKKKVLEIAPKLDLVVASLGGWWEGSKLNETSFIEWQKLIKTNLNAHFLFGKNFLTPLLEQNNGLYLMINGESAERPRVLSGLVSVFDSAQKMMMEMYIEENKESLVKMYSLCIYSAIKTRLNNEKDKVYYISSEDIANYIIDLYYQEKSTLNDFWHRLPKNYDYSISR